MTTIVAYSSLALSHKIGRLVDIRRMRSNSLSRYIVQAAGNKSSLTPYTPSPLIPNVDSLLEYVQMLVVRHTAVVGEGGREGQDVDGRAAALFIRYRETAILDERRELTPTHTETYAPARPGTAARRRTDRVTPARRNAARWCH